MRTAIRLGLNAMLLPALLGALAPRVRAEDPATFADAIRLESEGRFDEAVELGEAIADGLDEEQIAHLEKLRTVRLALGRARLLQNAGLRQDALDELDRVRKILGTETDLHLLLAVQQRRTELTEPDRIEAANELELAQALVDDGHADEALEKLKPLLELRPPERITEADLERTRALAVRAELLKNAPDKPGFVAEIGETLRSSARTVAEWLIYFVVLIAVYFVGTRIPRWMGQRPGTRVSLDDWTAPDGEREAKGRELTGELASAIRRIEAPAREGDSPLLNWDSAELIFGPGSLGEVASLSTYVQEADVAVGPIKFNARQLFGWIASLFRPRYRYALTGALSTGGPTTLTVERRDARDKPIAGAVFSAAAEGEGARTTVVRAVAAQIALFLSGNNAVTDNWRSLEQLLLAEEGLGKDVEPGKRRETLASALVHLESALRHDQANWIARVRLAAALRQLGRFRASADQYEYLHSRLMESRALRDSPHFQAFLAKHPDFPLVLRYNEAVSRCRVGRRHETHKARKIVDRLFEELKTRDDPRRLRLEVLARSLRAECWARRIEDTRDEEPSDELNKENGRLFGQIEQDEKWMWQQVTSFGRSQLTEYTYAHMVTRNALGRACYLIGRYEMAVKFLRWAIDFHLDAPNVDAKLNLASVYLRRKRKISPHWIGEAEPLLKDVIAIDPQNGKARYLLGRLYAHPAVNRLDEAKKQLDAAGDDPLSLFERARIAIEREHDLPAGLGFAQRSFQLDSEPGYRHYFVVSVLLAHLEEGKSLEREHLEFALDLAEGLARSRKSSFQKRAAEAKAAFVAAMANPAP